MLSPTATSHGFRTGSPAEDVVVKSSALWQKVFCPQPLTAVLLLAATAASPVAPADEIQRLITNTYRFEIPFEVDEESGQEDRKSTRLNSSP